MMLAREQRAEAISLSDPERLIAIADDLLQGMDVGVSRGPSVGLLMVRAEEPSQRLPFNFAEVTVSEAEVSVDGTRGYAMVLGLRPEMALAGAIVDAGLETSHPRSEEIELELAMTLEKARTGGRRQWAEVAPTMVRFEEMAP